MHAGVKPAWLRFLVLGFTSVATNLTAFDAVLTETMRDVVRLSGRGREAGDLDNVLPSSSRSQLTPLARAAAARHSAGRDTAASTGTILQLLYSIRK